MRRPKKVPLTGLEKTAILMNVLGEERCYEMMKHMEDDDLRKLLRMMGSVRKAPITLINDVLREYLYKLSEQEEIIFNNKLTDIEAVKKGLGEERVKQIFDEKEELIEAPVKKVIPVLNRIDEKTLAEFLIEEHPQTAALIVSHMDPAKQVSMIKRFPDAIRTEVLLRMAQLEKVDSQAIEELELSLNKHFLEEGSGQGKQFGGVSAIAQLIESLDTKTQNAIISRLEGKDPVMTEQIRQHMFVFSDIVKIDAKGIQSIIRAVPAEKLLMALKTASDELKEKVFSVLSERAAKMLQEDLEAMGPQKVSDIESAQRDIVTAVKKLEEEGKIIIGVGGDGELIP